MPELLFELGCEELPASSVAPAYKQLLEGVESRLFEAKVPYKETICMGTPRRLIIQIQGVEPRQPDGERTQRGPSLKSAFDEAGKPTKALEGFCRGQGVDTSEVEKKDDYVWVTKKIKGLPTKDLLATILPEAVRAITFTKTMRWGSSKMRFARPIRWMLAAFGGELIAFDIEGVQSGLMSRGHRFNHPDPFEARTLDQLFDELRRREVEPDPAKREERVRKGSKAATNEVPDMTDDLVDENVDLTEWPVAIEGTFPDSYMELPEPVLVTAMAKHERFFPVRDSGGKLTNRFISIRNGGQDDDVRKGNQWVLNARFNDAKFFFDEDQKFTMDDFLAKTERMTFADKLGNVRQRADRLSMLAKASTKAVGANKEETGLVEKAGLYAKADLSTGLVSELASLQGVVGGEYAEREGFEPAVSHALRCQYDIGKINGTETAEDRTALRLLMADQLDKLAGYLGIDEAPSGSSDPYALRRAATLLIDAAHKWKEHFHGYRDMFDIGFALYDAQGIELNSQIALTHLAELFASRYESLNQDARHDLVEAAQLDRSPQVALDPRRFALRLKCMEATADDTEFVQAATRPINIVVAAETKDIYLPDAPTTGDVDLAMLDSKEGDTLLFTTADATKAVHEAIAKEDADAILEALKELKQPIDVFFDRTMVMVEDEAVRDERLKMLKVVSNLLLQAGDFTKIVIEG